MHTNGISPVVELSVGMMGGKEVGWDALRERLGLRGVVGKEWCDGDGED